MRAAAAAAAAELAGIQQVAAGGSAPGSCNMCWLEPLTLFLIQDPHEATLLGSRPNKGTTGYVLSYKIIIGIKSPISFLRHNQRIQSHNRKLVQSFTTD